MNRTFRNGILALAAACGLMAQAPAQPAKQPQVKSKGEAEAIQAMFQAQDPDGRIKAAENLVTKYADTEFKGLAFFLEAIAYEQKGDVEKVMVNCERTLDADPRNYNAMLMLARHLAQRTREFDLDREEKLARVQKYVQGASELLKDQPKPNPNLTDEQWVSAKKDLLAQGHEALGLAAMARKQYDAAANEFKTAMETASQPDPATMVRLAAAYNLGGKYDLAIPVLDKVLATPDAHPQIKQFAQAERVRAIQAKSAGAKPAGSAPAAPAAPAPEAKKP
jgi:tetratricopeptide (TPR) repeat protein